MVSFPNQSSENVFSNPRNTDILGIFHIKFMHILPITLSYNTLFAVLFGKIDNSLISGRSYEKDEHELMMETNMGTIRRNCLLKMSLERI